MAERATPPGLAAQYHVLEGTGREIPAGKDWVVQHGPAKEAFGQPGSGDQWIVLDRATTNRPVPVEELIRRRLLRDNAAEMINWRSDTEGVKRWL